MKELTQEIKMTAEVKIESDAVWCSGQVNKQSDKRPSERIAELGRGRGQNTIGTTVELALS